MNSTCQILPGVRKIGWVDCEMLPRHISLYNVPRLPIILLIGINYITFFGNPECRCSTEKENNGWIQSTSLKFRSSDIIPFDRHIAFVVADVNDNWFIIGSYESPFPVVKFDAASGSPDGDPAGFSYEITHKAIRSMVPCKI